MLRAEYHQLGEEAYRTSENDKSDQHSGVAYNTPENDKSDQHSGVAYNTLENNKPEQHSAGVSCITPTNNNPKEITTYV